MEIMIRHDPEDVALFDLWQPGVPTDTITTAEWLVYLTDFIYSAEVWNSPEILDVWLGPFFLLSTLNAER